MMLACLVLASVACSSSEPSLAADDLRPPASWTADELTVLASYSTFRAELTLATSTKDGDLGTVETLSSPRLAEALIDNIVGDRSVGNIIGGRYDFTPLSVTFTGDEQAKILLCEWDQTFVVNEGEQLSDVPAEPSTATVDMKLVDDEWLVNGVFGGDGQPCELDQ